jgi:hypothetical protein
VLHRRRCPAAHLRRLSEIFLTNSMSTISRLLDNDNKDEQIDGIEGPLKRCKTCQSPIQSDMVRCPVCNLLLRQPPPLEPPMVLPSGMLNPNQVSSTTTGALYSLVTCPSCGTDVQVTTLSEPCPYCGHPLDSLQTRQNATKSGVGTSNASAGAPDSGGAASPIVTPTTSAAVMGKSMPGYAEGTISEDGTALPGEVRDADPLQALVALLIIIEVTVTLYTSNWLLLLLALGVLGLAYFIPDPKLVVPSRGVGQMLATLVALPFRPVRMLFGALVGAFNPERVNAKKDQRMEYQLTSVQGTQAKFTIKGMPHITQENQLRDLKAGEKVRIWTVFRRGRAYLRKGYLIDSDSNELIPIGLPRSYIGHYWLIGYVALHLVWWLATTWLF